MSGRSDKEIDYILNHLGENREEYYGATVPPTLQTSNFVFPDVVSFSKAFANEQAHHLYTRGNNPTVGILCEKLAALEKTEDALVFPSGMAAITMSILSFVRSGDHILCISNPYSWTKTMLVEYLPRLGITHDFFDPNDLTSLDKLKNEHTKMLIVESPNTMTFEVVDLREIGRWCRTNNVISLIDNSYASPIYQNPHEFGIDLTIHSGTKYLNGHSDVVFGAVCGTLSHLSEVRRWGMMTMGSILSPAEASMVLRGLRTLKIRMDRIGQTTAEVFNFLKTQKWIEAIHYPFDPDSKNYTLARSQMKGAPGLLSFELKTKDQKAIIQFVENLEYFKMAVSWGGYESLIVPILAIQMAHPNQNHELPVSLVRIYVGLEDARVLIDDLHSASMHLI